MERLPALLFGRFLLEHAKKAAYHSLGFSLGLDLGHLGRSRNLRGIRGPWRALGGCGTLWPATLAFRIAVLLTFLLLRAAWLAALRTLLRAASLARPRAIPRATAPAPGLIVAEFLAVLLAVDLHALFHRQVVGVAGPRS